MRPTIRLVFVALLVLGCNPYERRSGEYDAGPVDPVDFPSAYLGVKGNAKRSGSGTFTAFKAWVAFDQVGYYSFPFTDAQNKFVPVKGGAADPIAVSVSNGGGAFVSPIAYVFDPTDTSPFPDRPQCAAPAGYVYDQRLDDVHKDDQGNIFTVLPGSTNGYVPLVSEVSVRSRGQACQSIKSSDTLVTSAAVDVKLAQPTIMTPDAKPTGVSDGKIIAWALIDPGATVNMPLTGKVDPVTGLGPQKFGWFDHYLTAYIDGGYANTAMRNITVAGTGGAPDTQVPVVDLVTQTLYVPTTTPSTATDGSKVPPPMGYSGSPGGGFDVLEAKRGSPGYSPICHVMAFDQPDWNFPIMFADMIKSQNLKLTDKGYIYCLQVQQ